MLHLKNKFFHALLIGGIIGSSIFFILDNQAVDAEDAINDQASASSFLGDSGTLDIKASGVIAPVVGPNNDLFLFWKDKDSVSVYFNYYDGSSWSQPVQVIDPENIPIQANYGMAAALVYPNDNPMVCIFYKSASNASKDHGYTTPMCGDITYDENAKPHIAWKVTLANRLKDSEARRILSASESPDGNSIYLAWDKPNATACISGDPLCDPQSVPMIGKLYAYSCKVISGTIVNIDCGDSILPNNNIAGDVPGFIYLKSTYGEAAPFIFYAERYHARDFIYYFNMLSGSPTQLGTSNDLPRTMERIDVDQFLTVSDMQSHYIYVAYKDFDENKISFSKALSDNLFHFDQGNTSWTHCKSIGKSSDGPGLVNYISTGLYAFFPDNDQGGRIKYVRIDNIC